MIKKDFSIDINNNITIITPIYEIDYYNVRNTAWDFLIKNKVNSYPLNLQIIANNNNWIIWSYKKYCEYKKISQEKLLSKYPDGFTLQLKNGSYIICYNQNNCKQRNRFTICHEIGHILLHRKISKRRIEQEANMFSARILMPMILIKELKITEPEQLARLCDVSITSATFRLNRFQLIKERNKFYTNPLERKLYEMLKNFINKQKEG